MRNVFVGQVGNLRRIGNPTPALGSAAMPRGWLASPGGALRRCLTLLLFLVPALLLGADEWPQFRGNPQLTGVAAGALAANLKLLWTYEAGDSIESSAATTSLLKVP